MVYPYYPIFMKIEQVNKLYTYFDDFKLGKVTFIMIYRTFIYFSNRGSCYLLDFYSLDLLQHTVCLILQGIKEGFTAIRENEPNLV